MKKVICSLFLLLILLDAVISEKYIYGKNFIEISTPDGFAPIQKKGKYYDLVLASIPKKARLLIMFVRENEKDNVDNIKPGMLKRYIYISTMSEYENTILPSSVLESMKNEITKNQINFTDQDKERYGDILNKYFQQKSGDIKLKDTNFEYVGIPFNTENYIGVIYNTNSKFSYGSESITQNMVICGAMILINGKYLSCYISSRVETKDDFIWVKNVAENICKEIVKNNKK
jgi:hypothetical protein